MPKGKTYKVDYEKIEIPSDKDYQDFDVNERRAYLLERIKEKGTSQLVGRTDNANRFNTSPSVITQDILEGIAQSLAINKGEEIIEENYIDLQLKDRIRFYLKVRRDEEKK